MRIAVTGAHGTIGEVVTEGLEPDHDVTKIDSITEAAESSESRKIDVSSPPGTEEYRRLREELSGQDAVVHLAWNTEEENFVSNSYVAENRRMFENIYRIAHQERIPRVIMASSIHAACIPAYSSVGSLAETEEPFRSIIEDRVSDPDELIRPDDTNPDSPYGVTKIAMEEAGRFHTNPDHQNTESSNYCSPLDLVVCVRFGGIGPDDSVEVEGEPHYDTIYLSHRDCQDLIRNIVETDPNDVERFHTIYAISDNDGCPYSLKNDFGWEPQDNASR